MIKKSNKNRILSALLAGAMAVASFAAPAWADEKEHKIFPSISPTYTKVELDPGQTYTNTFNVGNIGSDTFNFKVYATAYQENEDANPLFDDSGKYNQIVDWITFDKEKATLAPGESTEIKYTVKVPDNAPGGGQYAALVAEAENEKATGDIQIENITRVAHLLYATINGDTNECAKILSNEINTFMFEPPINASSLIENCGNVHASATYTMKVYPLFSDKAIYTNEEEPMTRTVLPENRRYNTVSWTKDQGAPTMGIFNVEQTVKIGKETSTVKKLVFIFPLWLVIIIILFIGAVIFWLVSRSRQRKESKRPSVNTPEKSSD